MKILIKNTILVAVIFGSILFTRCQQEEEIVESFPQQDHIPVDVEEGMVALEKELPDFELSEPEAGEFPFLSPDAINPKLLGGEPDSRKGVNARIDDLKMESQGVDGTLTFENILSLYNLPDLAKYTLVNEPDFYIQKIGDGWVKVREYATNITPDYNKYRLSYKNFNPVYQGGKVYKSVNGVLVEVNPLYEPRVLRSYFGDQLISIYAYDDNNARRPFRLKGFQVINGTVDIWLKKADWPYDYVHYSNLSEGNYVIKAAFDIEEITINKLNGLASYSLDDFKIYMPEDPNP